MSLSYKNQNGFTIPVVVVLVAAFIIIPLGFWVFNSDKKVGTQVKGAQTVSNEKVASVTIITKIASWDLYQYLCKDKEECEKSLTSGKKWDTVHGGPTRGSSIQLHYSDNYNDYEYLKIFVRDSRDASNVGYFRVNATEEAEASNISRIDAADVILIPVKSLSDGINFAYIFTTE